VNTPLRTYILTELSREDEAGSPCARSEWHNIQELSLRGFAMATALYNLSVASYLQSVGAVAGCLDRAAKQCAQTGFDPDDFVGARLFEDMAPFHFQIECVYHHSVWALEAVKSGLFAPPALLGPIPFVDLQAMIARTETALKAFTPDEVNSWAGVPLGNRDYEGQLRTKMAGEIHYAS